MSDEVVTWIEIDLSVCSRRFGVAPCSAALSSRVKFKCVNTFKTCADVDNYDKTTITITLTQKGQVGLPFGVRTFPCLLSVDESEQTVNIAGSDPKLDALGRRATISVNASDFVYADRFLDPYYDERVSGAAQFSGVGYTPQGTFFQRLRARDPYFAGYPLRRRRGRVVDGSVVVDETLHYIMTEFTPSGGNVTIEGVDVLDLASNDRALAPLPSGGRLLNAITEQSTSLTLTPEGIGAEYPASGYITIGSEIIRYTSMSGDTMIGLVRQRFNTLPKSHNAAATAQLAWRYTGPAYLGVSELLKDYANVPETWIPIAEWEADAVKWFTVDVDVIVTKPTEVKKLIGEISVLGFSLFTDLAAQKIRFMTNRPLFPAEKLAAMTITDGDMVQPPNRDGRDSERLTRIVLQAVQIDPVKALEKDNFIETQITVDASKEDPRAHGDIRNRTIQTRWLNAGASGVIRILARRYLIRFATEPYRLTVRVKRRKYGELKLGDVVMVTSRIELSEFGSFEQKAYQVARRKNINAGEIEFLLQRYDYTGDIGFWATNDAPSYGDATETQKDNMAFWGTNTGDTFPDGRPLYAWS
jgi:hypothetical protein